MWVLWVESLRNTPGCAHTSCLLACPHHTQVNKICSIGYLNLKNISEIRRSLNKDNTKIIINSLITSHLDYGNSLLYGISNKLLNKLQVLQNSCVRLIERLKGRDRVSQARKDLHWLPVEARIEFKIIKLTWQCLNDMAPKYLSEKLKMKNKTRNLRCNDLFFIKWANYKSWNLWRYFLFQGCPHPLEFTSIGVKNDW